MAKKAKVAVGDHVEWSWGSGTGRGSVTRVHTAAVERVIKGHKVTRKASKDKPALDLKTNKGAKVLKSSSEVKMTR